MRHTYRHQAAASYRDQMWLANSLNPTGSSWAIAEVPASHERNEPLMAGSNSETFLVQSMVRLEQNRHDVGVEQQSSHSCGIRGWRRSSRISLRNSSTSSGRPRSL